MATFRVFFLKVCEFNGNVYNHYIILSLFEYCVKVCNVEGHRGWNMSGKENTPPRRNYPPPHCILFLVFVAGAQIITHGCRIKQFRNIEYGVHDRLHIYPLVWDFLLLLA